MHYQDKMPADSDWQQLVILIQSILERQSSAKV